MSLTPKNWKTFQHYSDRKPAWIKLHRALLDDYTFACLPLASQALAPRLWLLASEYTDGKITASLDEIAFRVHCSIDDLQDAINPLVKSGFFTDDSGLLAGCKQDAMLEREKEEQVEIEKDIRPVANATRSPSRFEEFWKAYPKRDGDNPKAPARKAFDAAVKQGVDPNAIISGVRAACAKNRSKIGTPYIPQAVKWLRDRRWEDYQSVEPAKAVDWEKAIVDFKELNFWPRSLGGEPGMLSCKAPREILERHGYVQAEPVKAAASPVQFDPVRFIEQDDSLPGFSEIPHQQAS